MKTVDFLQDFSKKHVKLKHLDDSLAFAELQTFKITVF